MSVSRKRPLVGLLVPLFVALSLCWPSAARAQERPTLYVYVHTTVTAQALQKQLQQALPEVTVTVFGRHRDFSKMLVRSPPDAVLARGIVLTSLGLSISLKGARKGQTAEAYRLLTLKGPISANSAASMRIGVVDLLGRKEMGSFVAGLLGSDQDVQVRRVTKLEDLLSVLSLNVADGVVLPVSFIPTLQKSSKRDLHIAELPGASVPLPSVAILNRTHKGLLTRALRGVGKTSLARLGLDSWDGGDAN